MGSKQERFDKLVEYVAVQRQHVETHKDNLQLALKHSMSLNQANMHQVATLSAVPPVLDELQKVIDEVQAGTKTSAQGVDYIKKFVTDSLITASAFSAGDNLIESYKIATLQEVGVRAGL